jgi:hypothetical protein
MQGRTNSDYKLLKLIQTIDPPQLLLLLFRFYLYLAIETDNYLTENK